MRYLLRGLFVVIICFAAFFSFLELQKPPSDAELYTVHRELEPYSDLLSEQWANQHCADPETLKNSVVIFSNATGFVVAPNIVVTNEHVTSNSILRTSVMSSFYEHNNGYVFNRRLSLLYDDKMFDISILRIDEAPELLYAEPVKLANRQPEYGDLLMYIGHPVGNKYNVSFGRAKEPGWLLRRMRSSFFGADIHYALHVKGYTRPGNSGSPVFNCAGEVVGVHHTGVYHGNNHEYLRSFFKPFSAAATLQQLIDALKAANIVV